MEESAVQDVMDTMLDNLEAGGKIKINNSTKSTSTTSSSSPPSEPDLNSKDPIVIDLEEEGDGLEFSKENVEKAPEKALTNLTKALTGNSTEDIIAKIKMTIGKLSREALEEMYCKKISELVESVKRIRSLESKLSYINVYKDKMVKRTQYVQKQISDLSKAMKTVTENMARSPNYSQQRNVPIKFFRTVGIQVRTEPLPKLPPKAPLGSSKVMNSPQQPTPSKNKKIPNAIPIGQKLVGPPPNGIITTPFSPLGNGTGTGQGAKRINQPTISVDDLRNQVQPSAPKKPRPGPASKRPGAIPARPPGSPDITSPNRPQTHTPPRTPTMATLASAIRGTDKTIMTNGNKNGFVDLTQNKGAGGIVVNQNGVQVQYRVVNSANLQQLVTTGTGGGFQIIPTHGQAQPRTIMLQQRQRAPPGPSQSLSRPRQQNYLIRTSPNALRPGVSQALQHRPLLSVPGQRQTGPGPLSRVSSPLNNTQSAVRYPVNATQPAGHSMGLIKFILPELPPGSTQPRKPKEAPPRPNLTLHEQDGGIVLSWTHVVNNQIYAEIQSYQIYACNEPLVNVAGAPKPQPPQWKRVGDVKALPLPMACTLSQFTDENRYHFIVRGVDVYNRTGYFCEVANILLKKRTK